MASDQSYLGIDIGATSVKVVHLVGSDGKLSLAHASAVPLDSPDAGDEEIRQALRQALSGRRVRPVAAASAVSARAAAVREIRLPNTEEANIARMVRFEAERFIPFPPEQVTLDHQYMGLEGADSARVLVVATRKQTAERVLKLLAGLGLPHPSLDVTAIASFNALVTDSSGAQPESIAIVDVGGNSTDIITARGAQLTLARSAPVGAEGLTTAYQQDLSVDFQEASRLKREQGVLNVPISPTASGAPRATSPPITTDNDKPRVAAWLGRLCGEVRHTIESSRRESADGITRVLLCGGGALTPGLREALEKTLGVPVLIADPWRGIDCDAADKDGPDPLFAVACGLARKAAGGVSIDINLTPKEVVDVRATQRRTRTILSVGSVLAAAVIAVAVVLGFSYRARLARLEYLNERLVPYEGMEGVADAEKEVVDRLEQIDAAMSVFRPGGVDPLELLRMISTDLPDDVWVTEFTYDPRDKFVIRGIAKHSASVSDSVRALLRKQVFDDVVLDYQNLGQIENARVYNFQITCVFPKAEEE